MISIDIIINIFKYIKSQKDFLKLFFLSSDIKEYYSTNFNNISDLYNRLYHLRLFGKEKYFINFSEFTGVRFQKINAFTFSNITKKSFKYFINVKELDLDLIKGFLNINIIYLEYIKNSRKILLNIDNKMDNFLYWECVVKLQHFTIKNDMDFYCINTNYGFSVNIYKYSL